MKKKPTRKKLTNKVATEAILKREIAKLEAQTAKKKKALKKVEEDYIREVEEELAELHKEGLVVVDETGTYRLTAEGEKEAIQAITELEEMKGNGEPGIAEPWEAQSQNPCSDGMDIFAQTNKKHYPSAKKTLEKWRDIVTEQPSVALIKKFASQFSKQEWEWLTTDRRFMNALQENLTDAAAIASVTIKRDIKDFL